MGYELDISLSLSVVSHQSVVKYPFFRTGATSVFEDNFV